MEVSTSAKKINRFKLKSANVVTEKERFDEAQVKLKSVIEKQEAKADAISRLLITDKLLNDKTVDPQELRELVRMGRGLSLNNDADAERDCQRNLNEMKTLTNMEVREVGTKLSKVTESDLCVKEWSVKIVPDQANFHDVILDIKMLSVQPVTSTEQLPRIKKIAAEIEGLDIDSDLEAGLEYCEARLEPQLLTRLVKEYLPLHSARLSLLDSVDRDICSAKPNSVLEFSNSDGMILGELSGDVINLYLRFIDFCLVFLSILIKFKRSSLSWEQSWTCKLTEEGKKACSRFNIPEELEITGKVDGWDWATAVETMEKVAKLDEDDSEEEDSFDASNVDTDTPKMATRRVPKRKLN